MTRRKSRPLLPHEILANLHPSSQNFGYASSSLSFESDFQPKTLSSQSSAELGQTAPEIAREESQSGTFGSDEDMALALPHQTAQVSHSAKTIQAEPAKIFTDMSTKDLFTRSQDDENNAARRSMLSRSLSQQVPRKHQPNSNLNHRSISFLAHNHEGSHERVSIASSGQGDHKGAENLLNQRSLERVSSLVRLSMSLDGKAKVTTGSGMTPSPPRSKPATQPAHPIGGRSIGMQRSQSLVETGQKDSQDPASIPPLRRRATGRSRDARTWEFYCDKDARDALNEHAEREESGSATAAIALLKSNSNSTRAITAKIRTKQGHLERGDLAASVDAEKGCKRPKLGRSKSSAANMQSHSVARHKDIAKTMKRLHKSGSQSAIFDLYEGDSDEENWVPGTQMSNPPRRQLIHTFHSRRILEESRHDPSSSRALTKKGSGGFRKSTIAVNANGSDRKENQAPEIDDEVATLMGQADLPRAADEMDCVQNLLSLSQGAWQ